MLCSNLDGKCCSNRLPSHSQSASGSSRDDDDIWGSDEENISVHAHLKRAHAAQGYLDGITHQQEANLQKGFDDGFPQGADLGRAAGRVLAQLQGTPSFEDAKAKLNVAKVLDKRYFDNQLDLIGTEHPLISEASKRE